ncbi:NAD(+)--rifampin ADP-ribosyltransferase [Penaeicola halotolerans]|uniref:NAD(+)--rifampin ADP-ribosyltransferase n=1 Tax=Penaeicola halotolerans TaxID=2793196 RepID=UPI003F68CF39
MTTIHTPFTQVYLHGTKADLKLGDLLEVGYNSNFGKQDNAKYIYFTATLDPAVWGAELAVGDGKERIYLVEPTGPIENDPNLTNQKYEGNPSMSFRSKHPLKVVGEVTIWSGHTSEQITAMKEGIAKLNAQGIGAIE